MAEKSSDGLRLEASTSPRRERRGGVGWGLVGAFFALTILGAVGGGGYIYFVLMRYERVAARHVPTLAQAAARLDVEQAILYEPVRRELLPVVDEVLASSPGAADGLERLEGATRIQLGRDLREVVVAVGETGWVIVVGGMFPRAGVVEGLVEVLGQRGAAWERRGDRAVGPQGVAIAQASDGVVVIASSVEWLEMAEEGSERSRELGLEPGGAGGVGIEVEGEGARSSWHSAGRQPRRARAAIHLGDPIEVTTTLPPSRRGSSLSGEEACRELGALLETGFRITGGRSDSPVPPIPSSPNSAQPNSGPRNSAQPNSGPRNSAQPNSGPRNSAQSNSGPRDSAPSSAQPRTEGLWRCQTSSLDQRPDGVILTTLWTRADLDAMAAGWGKWLRGHWAPGANAAE